MNRSDFERMRVYIRSYVLLLLTTIFTGLYVTRAAAQESDPVAEFMFIGTYHMSNPGRDVHNTKADDVLAAKRQREISEVLKLIERYHPTKVLVEADTASQAKINQNFSESCKGSRPFGNDEIEQLGFRIACDMKLKAVYAVDWNELGPIKDENSVDYRAAVERNHQQKQYDAHLAIGKKEADKQQGILDHGTVLDMLVYLNSQPYLKQNARAYYRIGMFGTPSDPVGASWIQLWFGRNVNIFNNIVRATEKGDRVLVIYGAGHGNYMRQLARDSGIYRVQDSTRWLKPSHK